MNLRGILDWGDGGRVGQASTRLPLGERGGEGFSRLPLVPLLLTALFLLLFPWVWMEHPRQIVFFIGGYLCCSALLISCYSFKNIFRRNSINDDDDEDEGEGEGEERDLLLPLHLPAHLLLPQLPHLEAHGHLPNPALQHQMPEPRPLPQPLPSYQNLFFADQPPKFEEI